MMGLPRPWTTAKKPGFTVKNPKVMNGMMKYHSRETVGGSGSSTSRWP